MLSLQSGGRMVIFVFFRAFLYIVKKSYLKVDCFVERFILILVVSFYLIVNGCTLFLLLVNLSVFYIVVEVLGMIPNNTQRIYDETNQRSL